jgi:2-polyprenyl-3-methyl-5-hydroxy-6-metoxy-1,4-benzoquinol methylase
MDWYHQNMSAIEGDPAVLDDLRKNVPGLTVFHHDFSSAGLTSLNIQKRYHVALLCEVLEHLYPGEDQMRLLRDTAELVAPGGGMHVTFPRQTHIDCVKGKPWGHKCEEVSRHEVMNILAELFDEVIWAQSASKGSFSGTVNFFALGRK